MSHCRCVLFYFILLFFIARYNQNFVSIFIIVSFGIFIIIIFFRRWFINYYQDQTIILRGVLDEVDEIISELPGDEGVRILVLLPHGRLADGHPSPITYFLPLNIARVDGIYDTIIIIILPEAPILIQDIVLALLIIFFVVAVSQYFLM